jgi:hypothetical protein
MPPCVVFDYTPNLRAIENGLDTGLNLINKASPCKSCKRAHPSSLPNPACLSRAAGYINSAMSLVEIEAELDQLGPDELRRLALKSWMTFVEKERGQSGVNECDESDPRLLASLDEAIAKADAAPGQGHSEREVRARLNEWTTG